MNSLGAVAVVAAFTLVTPSSRSWRSCLWGSMHEKDADYSWSASAVGIAVSATID